MAELKASARTLSGKERTGGASPPRLMEQESQMDPVRHEEWLGLRSRLEHAVAEGDGLAPAGTHEGIVDALAREPRNGEQAVAWVAERLEHGSTPVKLKSLMLVQHLFLEGPGALRAAVRETFEAPANALLAYEYDDPVRGALPAKLVRRWANDVCEIFRDADAEATMSSMRGDEFPDITLTIYREPAMRGLGMRLGSTHDGAPIVTSLPLRPDNGEEGAAERAGVLCGMVIRGCAVGGDPAHDVPGLALHPPTYEGILRGVREAVDREEHHFVLTVQPPMPGWRSSVKPTAGRNQHFVKELTAEEDTSRNLRGVQCSWCFAPSEHVCVEKNALAKDICMCQACYRKTVRCKNIATCNGAARRHEGGSDSECALCMGLVRSWLDPPVWPERWCSWCFERTPQELVERKKIGRSIYTCSKCQRPTQKCCSTKPGGRPGLEAMSRAGEDKCFKCEGLITDWTEPDNASKFQMFRSCSWCFTECAHDLVARHSVRRDTYKCSNCQMETARCRAGCEGMVRAASFLSTESICVACEGAEGIDELGAQPTSPPAPALRSRCRRVSSAVCSSLLALSVLCAGLPSGCRECTAGRGDDSLDCPSRDGFPGSVS